MPERPSGRVRPLPGRCQAHLQPPTRSARSWRPPAGARRPPPYPLATHGAGAWSLPSADGLLPHLAALAARHVGYSSCSASCVAEDVALLDSGLLFGSQWSALCRRVHKGGRGRVHAAHTRGLVDYFDSHLHCGRDPHAELLARPARIARPLAQLLIHARQPHRKTWRRWAPAVATRETAGQWVVRPTR